MSVETLSASSSLPLGADLVRADPFGPPRDVHTALPAVRKRLAWWLMCLLCGGLIGLTFAVIGALRSRAPSRGRLILVTGGAALQTICAGVFASTTVLSDIQPCPVVASMAPDPTPATGTEQLRAIVNSPVSGAAIIYASARGATICRCADDGITAALLPDGFLRGGTMYGTVFITDPKTEASADRIRRLSDHEAAHADQWATATAAGGPLTFPVLYSMVESLFPGAHNPFERAAGLSDGGYDIPPDRPPAAGRLIALLVGLLIGVMATRRLHRAQHRSHRLIARRFPESYRLPDHA